MVSTKKNTSLNDKQYRFRSSSSTADVLTLIINRICEELDNKFDSRVIVLATSMTFDKVGHKWMLQKHSSYRTSGNFFSVIKSLLTGRPMQLVVNGQSPETQALPNVLLSILSSPFLFYIDDLPKNIHWSLVNMNADDTNVYDCTWKNLDIKNSAAWVVLTVERGKNLHITFNTCIINLVTFHHHRKQTLNVPLSCWTVGPFWIP